MSLASTSDKRDRLSAGRNRSQHSFRPVSKAERVSASNNESDGARARRLSFAEDFLMEHTHSGLHITVVGMAGASADTSREQQMSTQCYGFPS